MSEDQTYNGHANYQTWVINMYVTGNYTGQATYEYWDETAQIVFDAAEPNDYNTKSESARYRLVELLKDEFDQMKADLDRPSNPNWMVISDLLGSSLDRVSWNDIADGLLDPVEGYEPS